MPDNTRTIGIFFDTSRNWLRDVFQGVADWAAQENWVLEFADHRALRSIGEHFPLDGILCDDVTGTALPPFPDIPRVWLHPDFSPHVGTDEIEAGRMCAHHLRERGYRNLAVFQTGDTRRHALHQHETGFREAVEDCSVETFITGTRTRERGIWTLEDQMQDLADFLRTQTFPVGVMGTDTEHVKRLYSVCRLNGFRIPEDVAIVSPGDDPIVFNHTRPGISAVAHNQRKIGREAARALSDLMRGEPVPDHTLVPPLDLTVRGSTDHRVMNDPLCKEVVAHIWDHLEEAPSQTELARRFHVTPRTLHRHFTRELGRTPTEETLYARIETAKRLLITTDLPLVEIALRCGYSSQSAFNRHFKNETGHTPLELRGLHR